MLYFNSELTLKPLLESLYMQNHYTRGCREHNAHSQRTLVAPLPSRHLALPAARRSAILLKRVKWESAHGGSRPRDCAVAVSLRKGIQLHLASTRRQDRGNPDRKNDCGSRAARRAVVADQIRQITKRLQI